MISKMNKKQRRAFRDAKLAATNDNTELMRATAYHEAAHAIVGELLDFPTAYVEIIPKIVDNKILYGNTQTAGDPRHGGQLRLAGRQRTFCRVVANMAGDGAEHRLGTMPKHEMSDSDVPAIFDLLPSVRLPDETMTMAFSRCRLLLDMMLDAPQVWAAIAELAELLLKVRRVVAPVPKEIAHRHAGGFFLSKFEQLSMTVVLANRCGEVMPAFFAAELEAAKLESGSAASRVLPVGVC